MTGPHLTSGQELENDLDLTGLRLVPGDAYGSDTDLATFGRSLFGGRLAQSGKNYLFTQRIAGQGYQCVPYSPAIELAFELVRRNKFPNQPSRLASMYAWPSLANARWFKRTHRNATTPIFKVSCNEVFQCDFDLVRAGPTILATWLLAEKYWRGEAGPNPLWEVLLVPPVRVGDRLA